MAGIIKRRSLFKRRRFPEGTLASARLDKTSPLEPGQYVVVIGKLFKGGVAKVIKALPGGRYRIDIQTMGTRRFIDARRRGDLLPITPEVARRELEIAEKARKQIIKPIPGFIPHAIVSGPLNVDPEFREQFGGEKK